MVYFSEIFDVDEKVLEDYGLLTWLCCITGTPATQKACISVAIYS